MSFGSRIGILGGTFDPIHNGHLIMAENAAQDLALSSVVFAPAGSPPHKPDLYLTPTEDRLAMVSLAIEDRENFHLSRIDVDDVQVSYTWMLLERFRAAYPNAELWFIMGGDSLGDFPKWMNPSAILDAARLAVIDRPGFADTLQQRDESAWVKPYMDRVDAPLCDVSSTDIRERVRTDRSIRYLVPDGVRSFILQRGLYRSAPGDK